MYFENRFEVAFNYTKSQPLIKSCPASLNFYIVGNLFKKMLLGRIFIHHRLLQKLKNLLFLGIGEKI